MPFLITLLAGLSTMIGYFFIYLKNKDNDILIISLGFASGVMFFISIFDLIPEAISCINNYYYMFFSLMICSLFFTIGITISSILNRRLDNKSNLYKVGVVTMLAIIIHNIPEGIITYLTTTNNLKLGITLAISIALHNIPEGISISVPIYYSTNNKLRAFLYTFLSGISEFIGSVIAFLFFRKFNNNLLLGCLYSFVSGIMIYVSLIELFISSYNYNNKKLTFISFIFGILFIYISIILIK